MQFETKRQLFWRFLDIWLHLTAGSSYDMNHKKMSFSKCDCHAQERRTHIVLSFTQLRLIKCLLAQKHQKVEQHLALASQCEICPVTGKYMIHNIDMWHSHPVMNQDILSAVAHWQNWWGTFASVAWSLWIMLWVFLCFHAQNGPLHTHTHFLNCATTPHTHFLNSLKYRGSPKSSSFFGDGLMASCPVESSGNLVKNELCLFDCSWTSAFLTLDKERSKWTHKHSRPVSKSHYDKV